jgi:glycosyltransferase involved in cell wall biosynthesis
MFKSCHLDYIHFMGHFLFLEPFYGGSHKYFADGLKQHSKHTIDLFTLPDRYWKWRMRGGALYFAEKIKNPSIYDGIILSNMLSLSDLKSLWNDPGLTYILYFHENQILYPLAEGEKEDLHYGFTDITSSLAADFIVFNSHFHKKAFIDSLKPFLSRFPDNIPYWLIDKVKEKSTVIHPGCLLNRNYIKSDIKPRTPLIIWNHRWEHDKNPDDFFSALYELDDERVDFQLAVLGEQFNKSPEVFNEARVRLEKKIVHFGFVEHKEKYREWLEKGDIVISTSNQENFGISIVEAIGGGSFPLLPDRLSYRELIPEKYHKLCIYKNQKDLKRKLKKLISFYDPSLVNDLILLNKRFSWEEMILKFDDYLENVIKKIPI